MPHPSSTAAPAGAQLLIAQPDYAKRLRPLLPADAFTPDRGTLTILGLNGAILVLGWAMARQLQASHWQGLLLFLPFALVMGNAVVVMLFGTHDMMHSKAIRQPQLRWIVQLLGLALLWMPPTLWKAVHNREHHGKTNSEQDPDRNYNASQPASWGKWIQNLFVPSVEVNPFWLAVGMTSAWGVHAFRNISSVLLFNNGSTRYPVFSFQVSPRERRQIALELAAIVLIHITIIAFIGLHPVPLLLGYFLPIWIGYSVVIAYIYTNHMACRATDTNDPLINSISLKMPAIFDALHFNFSYHTEHHIFPGMNPDYYPQVRALLLEHYPDRFNLLSAPQAWQLLKRTPRHYLDATTFASSCGTNIQPCPLLKSTGQGSGA
ncbi:fatty acid desaturase family protein [Synechococcus sp. BA-132 BA5]|uniref:fatty acid desaturase family protein n=1 Tax=Synechococcus sp. BA-132 BA5 TaxID=3110252 RepID=UPI002B1FF68B|nr:fatty acid desaturase [Synechococcus sp. BA-132 BA5]MEA5415171.1 fatty acid desaturase [Synechococcus sp. BA-132 BA5]